MISMPLLCFANLTWRALKPKKLGIIKFTLAHALPMVIVLLGFISIFAPKLIPELIFFGVLLISLTGVVVNKNIVKNIIDKCQVKFW